MGLPARRAGVRCGQAVVIGWVRFGCVSWMDEWEVVLLKGTPYRRVSTRRLSDPKKDLEYWEVDLVEREIA